MKLARSVYLFSLLFLTSFASLNATINPSENPMFWLCCSASLVLVIHNYKVLYKAWYDQAYTTLEEREAHPLGVKNFFCEYFCKFRGGKFGEASKGFALLAIACAAMLATVEN